MPAFSASCVAISDLVMALAICGLLSRAVGSRIAISCPADLLPIPSFGGDAGTVPSVPGFPVANKAAFQLHFTTVRDKVAKKSGDSMANLQFSSDFPKDL